MTGHKPSEVLAIKKKRNLTALLQNSHFSTLNFLFFEELFPTRHCLLAHKGKKKKKTTTNFDFKKFLQNTLQGFPDCQMIHRDSPDFFI